MRRSGGGGGGSQLTWKCAKAARTKMACIIKQSESEKTSGQAMPRPVENKRKTLEKLLGKTVWGKTVRLPRVVDCHGQSIL